MAWRIEPGELLSRSVSWMSRRTVEAGEMPSAASSWNNGLSLPSRLTSNACSRGPLPLEALRMPPFISHSGPQKKKKMGGGEKKRRKKGKRRKEGKKGGKGKKGGHKRKYKHACIGKVGNREGPLVPDAEQPQLGCNHFFFFFLGLQLHSTHIGRGCSRRVCKTVFRAEKAVAQPINKGYNVPPRNNSLTIAVNQNDRCCMETELTKPRRSPLTIDKMLYIAAVKNADAALTPLSLPPPPLSLSLPSYLWCSGALHGMDEEKGVHGWVWKRSPEGPGPGAG